MLYCVIFEGLPSSGLQLRVQGVDGGSDSSSLGVAVSTICRVWSVSECSNGYRWRCMHCVDDQLSISGGVVGPGEVGIVGALGS